ncbi:MAG: HD domain-containing protein [Deltaproteobacteria bacterium]|nr:HD domain-containing protein [Deltaproteobacteria bacterium]
MKCPGQDSRYWKPGAIFEVKCPKCGKEVEFFKDDTSRKCQHCGNRFVNPHMDFGCAAYCPYAEQCLGTLPPEVAMKNENLLKDRVAVEMKRYFGRDFKRIGHASRVARYAEKIGKAEGGNLAVILTAAFLHDIGIKESEKKYQSTAAKYQELEGPPIARKILSKLGAPAVLIDEACDIIGHHHHPRQNETVNFKCLFDADTIVNLEEQHKENSMDTARLEKIIAKQFLTETGANLARKMLQP